MNYSMAPNPWPQTAPTSKPSMNQLNADAQASTSQAVDMATHQKPTEA